MAVGVGVGVYREERRVALWVFVCVVAFCGFGGGEVVWPYVCPLYVYRFVFFSVY